MSTEADTAAPEQGPRGLSGASLDSLLRALGDTPAEATAGYEALRRQLIHLFRWNNCDSAEELADVALDRLARRLTDEPGVIKNAAKFAAGIGRMIILEQHAQRARTRTALARLAAVADTTESAETTDSANHEAALASLAACLAELPPSDRGLLERYFAADGGERIRSRQRLAEDLGLSLNALRNKVLRLRRALMARLASHRRR